MFPRRSLSEGKIVPDKNMTNFDLIIQNLFDEIFRRLTGIFFSKGSADRHVNALLLDQAQFLFQGGNQERLPLRRQNFHRMGIEGIDDGFSIDLSGFLQNPLENKLVSQMNPVKIPDGEHGLRKVRFRSFSRRIDFHKYLKNARRKSQGARG